MNERKGKRQDMNVIAVYVRINGVNRPPRVAK